MLSGYRLLDPIAVGPRSVVTRAIRISDSTLVVMKSVRRPEDGERLRQEFAVTRALPGKYTVRPLVLESGPDGPILISHDVGGESLTTHIRNRLPLPKLLRLTLQMIDAIAEVHATRLVHKDIKPSNFCLDAKGQSVYLTDFSIAEPLPEGEDDLPRAASIGGTLAYISPEQTGRTEQLVDYRTDYYSLGVTLYELLSGRLPFDSADPLEIVHGHLAKDPPALPADVPAPIATIVFKLLAKSPDERYQSTSGLRRDIATCLEGIEQQGGIEEFAIGTYDVPERFRVPTRLYGRANEVRTLLSAFERTAEPAGGSSLVLVSGYSGIGKSSLIHELRRPIMKARGHFVSGKFDQVRRDVPYATLAQSLDSLALQLLSDSDARIERLRADLRAALGANARVIVDLGPRFATLLGVPPPIAELPPAEARARLHAILGRFFAALATADHPVVLFFDDLHWADPASLRVLQSLLTQGDVGHLLIVGAYRDNEVTPTHPLMLTLAEVEKERGRIEHISLSGLPEETLEQLISDMFSITPERARGLAQLLHERTLGNPFFAIRFLQELHRDGLLAFDASKAVWCWDLQSIRERKYAENVVELLTSQIERLGPRVQRALEIAACIGNVVTTHDLSVASGRTEAEIADDMAPALRQHLVVQVADGYKFSHDRVQQAAYERIHTATRPHTHRALGQALLANTPASALEGRIFDIASQLGRGLPAMQDERAERRQLAEIELTAARRARRSCAFRTASQCSAIGIEALGPSGWVDAPTTMQELCTIKADCDYLSSEFAQAEALCHELMQRIAEGVDKVSVYRTLIGIYTSTGRMKEATDIGLEGLRHYGITISATPDAAEVSETLGAVSRTLSYHALQTLALPQMKDPHKIAAMKILLDMAPAAVFIHKGLFAMVVSTIADLSLNSGVADESAPGFGYLGMILVDRSVGEYKLGWLAGRIGWELMERRNSPGFRAKVGIAIDIVNPYGRHYRDNRRYLIEALRAGQETGDPTFTCYTCSHLLTNMLVCGDPLDAVSRESERLADFVARARDQNMIDIVVTQKRLLATLRGNTTKIGSFDGSGFDETTFEQRISKSQMTLAVCWYYIRKTQARIFGGAYQEAVVAADIAETMLSSFTAEAELAEHLFYSAIALSCAWNRTSEERRAEHKARIVSNQRQFDIWARNCPENFTCRRDTVSAELARIEGRVTDAEKLYESAIASAKSNGFIHIEALACELAGLFYRQRGLNLPANAYLRASRDAYVRWGATGKVRAMEQAFHELRNIEGPSAEHPNATPATTTGNLGLHLTLDIAAVLRATRAISEEIVLDKLVSTVLRVMLADAGAERGHLILLHNGDPALVASGQSDVAESPNLTSIPLSDCDDILPVSLARLVLRTSEAVIVTDAVTDARFVTDRYVTRQRPRSLASVPIVNHGKLLGLLLLEHRRLASVFSSERLELIRILAAQAAVSIDNALLYGELDLRVRQRTYELEEAQRRLVDTAHRAGMAEIATNVLHNVGNALNSVSVSADVVLARLRDSRVGTIEKVAHLVTEHKADLPGFFAKDPRAKSIPDLLVALAKRLEDERLANVEDVSRACKHVGHIRDIVSLQQSFAGPARLIEDVMVPELLEDAIRISAVETTARGIEILRDFAPLPTPWPLEKRRILQILVNLISNAGHALAATETSRKKIIVVSAHVESDAFLRISVRDTGCGIAPDVMPHLFTFGFTTRAGGHGFGLHSCAIAAKSMGGEIVAHSDGEGLGATFTLIVPCVR